MPKPISTQRFSLRSKHNSINTDNTAVNPVPPRPLSADPTPPESPTARRRRISLTRKSQPSKPSTKEAAIQTRTELRINTRNDWTFPEPSDLIQSRRIEPDTLYTERELELSSSPRSISPPPRSSRRELTNSDNERPSMNGAEPKDVFVDETYRFESPDDVGATVRNRKRRWRQTIHEERKWNTGLRHWELRRDAWTAAVKVRLDDSPRAVYHRDLILEGNEPTQNGFGESTSVENSSNSTSISPSLSTITPTVQRQHSPSSASSSSSRASAEHQDYTKLVPIPPPLIPPEHPIRSQIQPRNYGSIYTKIVVQGSTPSIPVNLRDVVCACVTGWKADGEWPPRLSYPEPDLATMNGHHHRMSNGHVENMAKIDSPRKANFRSRIGSIVGSYQDSLPKSPTSPAKDESGRVSVQDSGEAKSIGMVGRGVQRVSRALKMVGDVLLDNDEVTAGEAGDSDVPGLVQDQETTMNKLREQGLA